MSTVRRGSRGSDVKTLQQKLISMGYDLGAAGADGIFGPKTEAAVRQFQKDQGLAVDGIAGPNTWGAIEGGRGGGGSKSGKSGGGGGGAKGSDIEAYIRSNYGYVAWAIDHKELGPILREAAEDGWDAARIQGAILDTDWWRENQSSLREYELRKNEDPASLEADVQATQLDLRMAAGRLGVNISDKRLRRLAEDATKFGWSENEIRSALVAEADYQPNRPAQKQDLLAVREELGIIANDWMVPMSDQKLHNWATRIAEGSTTKDTFQAILRDQALSRYPHLKHVYEAGGTTSDFFEPYKQTIGQMLEINPDSIDLTRGKWSQIVDYTGGEERRPMTLYEVQDFVRSQDEWRKTDQANTEAAQFAEMLGQTFGRVA